MRETRYEQVSSMMLSLVLGLIFATAILGILWAATRQTKVSGLADMTMVELTGGYEDGRPDETLKVESPEEEIEDPALTEEDTEETEIDEVFENVVELSDNAAEQVEQQFMASAENSGKVGSKTGTGHRPLGTGGGDGGTPAHKRWFIRFGAGGSLVEYAKQLDFFGIELGGLFPSQGRLVYLKKLSAASPQRREVRTGANEKRLYMNWQSGSLQKSDHRLFQKAGVDTRGAMILHFYPETVVRTLLTAEKAYRKRDVRTIRRTIFTVRKVGRGYRFVVTRQTYIR